MVKLGNSNMIQRNAGRGRLLLLVGLLLLVPMSGCRNKTEESASTVNDHEIADYQEELLQIAFDTASQIPTQPHIKDRSRTQQAVIEACLKLDQPLLATRLADRIDNWRRGLSYANVAYYLATNGHDRQLVQKGLDLAELIAQLNHPQQWHADRIRSKINQTNFLINQAENGHLAAASSTPPADNDDKLNSQIKIYDDLAALGGHETTLNAISGYTDIFTRYYDNWQYREMMPEKIRFAWTKTPISIRLEILARLAQTASDHHDQQMSLELLNESQTYIDNYQWPHDKYIIESAKLLTLRFRSMEDSQLTGKVDELLSFYETHRESIVSIYRTEALLPIAEAYQTMKQSDKALIVYKKTLEESVINPNSRPRAEDVSAICSSMAAFAVEPDQMLWTRIEQVRQGLGDPW